MRIDGAWRDNATVSLEAFMLRTRRPTLGTMTLCLAMLLWAVQAQAHAKLVSADPGPDVAVAAPKSIHLEFSAELAKKFSSFKLTDTDGKPVPMTAMEITDAKALESVPTATLSPGLYTVSWTAVSTDDGHKTIGSYSFTVQ
jgi:copper resistance protein C